jgi:hypothetical protein
MSDPNRALGFAGSVALAIGGLSAGALPLHDPFGHIPGIRELRTFPLTAMAGAFLGLTLLLSAWLRMRKHGHTPRELTITLLWWAAPLAIAPPLFSRDVFSYLAQGALVRHGFDAYLVGPSALADDLTLNVPPVWQDTPAPYGPVFLRVAAGVVGLTDEHTVLGVLGLRALAIGGVLLIVRCLPALAARVGADPASALWLGALNPLVLIHLVAGAHNDALMIGLMLAGLRLATRGSMAAAIGLIGTATLIKAPAVVALACVAQLWAVRLSGRLQLMRAAALTGAGGLGVVGLLTFALGLGHGWLHALGTPTAARNGLSMSTELGLLIARATGPDALTWTRTVFAAAGAAIALTALLRWPGNPGRALGVALCAIVLCGPVVHPWYVLWGLIPLAAGGPTRDLRRLAIAVTVPLCLYLMPYGMAPTAPDVAAGVVGLGAGLCYLRLRPSGAVSTMGDVLQREPVAVDTESADHPGRDGGHHGVVPELLARVNV